MNRVFQVFSLFSAFAFLAFGCSELPCLELKVPSLKIEFFKDSNSVLLPRNIRFQKIETQFGPEKFSSENNNVLRQNRSPAQNISIPISPNSDSLLLIISDTLSTDSLMLLFRKDRQFVSNSCGYIPTKTDLKIKYLKSKRFKRTELLQTKIDSTQATHVQIIF